MFSKTCEYAIRAMIYVANNSAEDNKKSVKDIAEGIDSPTHFIAKILQDLSRKGLIQSTKGPNGGFYMTSENLKVTLADIIISIDGTKMYKECILGLKACSEETPCPIHFEYKAIKKAILKMLEGNSITNFNEQNIGNIFLKQ